MSLTIARTTAGTDTVLRCSGRIVLGSSASALRYEVETAIRGGTRHIVVDLEDVDYMDSSGIGEVVSAYTTARNSGGELVLCGLQKKVRNLLEITKLNTVFQVFEDSQAALACLNAGKSNGDHDDPDIP